MIRMIGFTALLLLAAAPLTDAEAATLHRAQFSPADVPYLYYATAATVPAESRQALIDTFKFEVSSLTRDQNVDDHRPRMVVTVDAKTEERTEYPHLWYIDTRYLGWEHTLPAVLIEHYPYAPDLTRYHKAPLVFRMDWFVANVVDEEITKNAQYLLLFGRDIPNVKDWIAGLSLSNKRSSAFGFLEGQSKVRRADSDLERIMESNEAGRGAWFATFDSAVVVGDGDALEFPDQRPPKHDASEYFAPLVKVGKGPDGKTVFGTLFSVYLANGNRTGVAGARQAAAPNKVVEDSHALRGSDIRQWIDCFSCHDQGLKHPSFDLYKQAVVDGVVIKVLDSKEAKNIDRYYQSAFARDVDRGIEDFKQAVLLVNGLAPEANAANLRACIRAYDAPVSRGQAALELGTTPQELAFAVDYYLEKYPARNARLVRTARGGTISRQQFEFNFYKFQEALQLWSKH